MIVAYFVLIRGSPILFSRFAQPKSFIIHKCCLKKLCQLINSVSLLYIATNNTQKEGCKHINDSLYVSYKLMMSVAFLTELIMLIV